MWKWNGIPFLFLVNSFKTAIPNKAEILQQSLRQTISLKQKYIIMRQTIPL